MNQHPFRIIAIVIYAGFNALLLLTTGLLITFSRQIAWSPGWRILCGLVLLSVSGLIGTAIYGLWSRREWGRRGLRGGLLLCLPLNAIAIFPFLQNHRMTMGNTVLQTACMAASIGAILFLTPKRVIDARSAERPSEGAAAELDHPVREEDGQFTFDRHGHADRLTDN